MAIITRFSKISPVRFQISFDKQVMHENNPKDDTILELYDEKGRIVTIGDPFYIPNQGWLRVKHIRKERNINAYYIISDYRTDTSILLLSLINVDKELFWSYDKFMINSYDRVINQDPSNYIYVLYKIPYFQNENDIFMKHHENFHNNIYYSGIYYKNKDTIVYSFKIPDNHIKDLENFRDSKFSKMSEEAKEKILTFHKKNPELCKRFKDELYLNNGLRLKMEKEYNISIPFNAELRSSIYPEKETLDINNIITDDRD